MFLTIIAFVVVLGVLIFVHELGHYFASKMFGVKTEEFGFGLPPRICGWRKKDGKRKFFWGNKDVEDIDSDDTIWSFNWLPLGGFVKIKGEDGSTKDEDSFAVKKAWKRIVILAAGVTMNLVLAAVLLSVALMIGAPPIVENVDKSTVIDPKVQVMQVLPGSVADESGLKMGDVVLSINDQEFESATATAEFIRGTKGESIHFELNRFDEIVSLDVTPKYDEETDKSQLGVQLIDAGIIRYPWYQAIWLGIKSTAFMTIAILSAFYNIIKNLMVGLPAGVEVAGPVGIAVMSGQAARMGIVYIMQFGAMLSINLAIINFLPFPALDGGRILFIIIEKILRRPVNPKVENIIHAVGFFILIALLLVVTGRDIFMSIFG